ncbi:dTDP-4-dehydrorhamnose 3,5-epimerase family protein [Ekhidna sp.]|uniref:dTDP-4-dehydrorhamnose 3,5-epimerase family protein n=1 Tax=Ekhidna sp. TaxID=2608089 RepID=UPI003B503005
MKFIKSRITGVFIIENSIHSDSRGEFVKVFHQSTFNNHYPSLSFTESYYSISNEGVIRGMHLQLPPKDHHKLVYVPKGKVLDVVLDLRADSRTYGECESFVLSAENAKSIFIPKGCAHGFKSLEDNSITVYSVTSEYDAGSDTGVRWDTFGFDWGVKSPNMSKRDHEFMSLKEFQETNPF